MFIYKELYCRYGCIEIIVYDRGPEFVNAAVTELNASFKVNMRMIRAGRP